MKIKTAHDFTGYPDGKRPVDFKAGQILDVPDEFAKLVIGKGHAEADKPAAPVAPVAKAP